MAGSYALIVPCVIVASLVLTANRARAQIAPQDCDVLEYVLSLEGQLSDLDLDERDALARRLERHGEALGLSAGQVRIQASTSTRPIGLEQQARI